MAWGDMVLGEGVVADSSNTPLTQTEVKPLSCDRNQVYNNNNEISSLYLNFLMFFSLFMSF